MILFLPSQAKALTPLNVNVAFNNRNSTVSPSYIEINNAGWYYGVVGDMGQSNTATQKIAFQYNLSSYTKDYITFIVMGEFNNMTATINGKACQIDGFQSTTSQYGLNFAGITCDNPKGTYWLNVYMSWNKDYNATTGIRTLRIMTDVEQYDDKLAASINTSTTIQVQNDNTNWTNFNNQDISQQDQQPVDQTTINQAEQKIDNQANTIQTALNNATPQQYDLTSFIPTFQWIWQTIIYIFSTHTILMTTMVIVLSIGFMKTIFGR